MSRRILLLFPFVTFAIAVQQSTVNVSAHFLQGVPRETSQNPSNTEYRIKPKDVLHIHIIGSTCNEIVEVDEQGMIQITFVDDIQAAGKTVNELKEEIRIKLKKLLKNPAVEIRLIQRST